MTNRRTRALAIVSFIVLLSGCAGTSTVASPTPEPAPVTSPAEAIALVLLHEPRLAGIVPQDPNLIGQASWYAVAPASGVGAFVVTVRIGWGDCQSGCINEHRWLYAVGPDGLVTIVSEGGAPVPDDAWPAATAAHRTGIAGIATAGPVCPVEKKADPACAPRPVVGATVVISDASGTEILRVTTDAAGAFFAPVKPGGYVVEPRPVEGLLGTPDPFSVVVNDGIVASINFGYDTGIR